MATTAASGTRLKNRAISQSASAGAFAWFRSATGAAFSPVSGIAIHSSRKAASAQPAKNANAAENPALSTIVASTARMLVAASAATSQRTARGFGSQPASPAAIAVKALPARSNASFLPTLLVNSSGPTIPREIAPTTAGNTASTLPIAARAAATTQKFGDKDIATAPVTAAMAINARFHRVQSIKAPNGARA